MEEEEEEKAFLKRSPGWTTRTSETNNRSLEMRAHALRLATCRLPPFYIPVTEGNVTRVEGYLSFLINYIIKSMNTSVVFVVEEANDMGHEISPGNWTSVIGMLTRQEADIFAGMYPAMPELFPHVAFSSSFDATSYSILSSPYATSATWVATDLLGAVGHRLWLCFIFTWLAVSIVYHRISKVQDSIGLTHHPDTFWNTLFNFYGFLFSKNAHCSSDPTTTSTRLVVTGWLIMVMVVMTVLGGIFSSKLAVTDVPQPLDSVSDLLEFPELKPYFTKGVVVDTYFQLSKRKEQHSVWKRALSFGTVRDMEEFYQPWMLNSISEGKAVAISNTEGVLVSMVAMDCAGQIRPYHISKEPFLMLSLVLLHRKGLDYVTAEKLSLTGLRYGSAGFHLKFWKLTGDRGRPCLEVGFDQATYSPLALRDLWQVVKLWAIALTAASTVFVIEIISRASSCSRQKITTNQLLGKIRIN